MRHIVLASLSVISSFLVACASAAPLGAATLSSATPAARDYALVVQHGAGWNRAPDPIAPKGGAIADFVNPAAKASIHLDACIENCDDLAWAASSLQSELIGTGWEITTYDEGGLEDDSPAFVIVAEKDGRITSALVTTLPQESGLRHGPATITLRGEWPQGVDAHTLEAQVLNMRDTIQVIER